MGGVGIGEGVSGAVAWELVLMGLAAVGLLAIFYFVCRP